MIPINHNASRTNPAITLSNNTLTIAGRSIPVHEATFYDPYIEWGKQLKSNSLIVEIKLEYMNSSSTKKLLLLLKVLDSNLDIENLIINWYYEDGDEELKDHGLVFKKILSRADFRIFRYKG
jgi:hypothetical protein